MIVKGQHRSWHVIAQPDHGDVVSEIAAARGNDRFGSPRMFGSLIVAARRPDDRWAVWERQPGVDQDSGNGRPRNAFDIDIPVHLAFFRAVIEAVKGE